jgi:hypothetical protein
MEQNLWKLPQERLDIKPFHALYRLDEDEQATLDAFLNEPQVEIYYDLNDERDYAVGFETADGIKVARISDTVTINGVRWHLVPGKNLLPKSVYEFLKQCPEQCRRISAPQPGRASNIMGHNQLFKASYS